MNSSAGIFESSVRALLKPVVQFLDDPSVTEVMINGPHEIFIERKGLIEKTDAKFEDESAIMAAARNIAQFVGRTIDADNPTMDARLPDGSRLHVVIPPVARNGTTIAIRKFSDTKLTIKDLINFGALTVDAARFIDVCIYLKKNIIVSGGTGSGKTTLLGIIASRISGNERILVIEDASELKIHAPHVVFFETRKPDSRGKGEVTMRELIRSALRLRPDRIIVGEVRGGEAIDLIQAMSTGHGGSMGTTHANTPGEAMTRLETLCMIGDSGIPIQAIRLQLAHSVDVVIQTSRLNDGSRKITHISEILSVDMNTGIYETRDIWLFKQTGRTPEGKIIGYHAPAGNVPTFMEEIQMNGLPFDESFFQDPQEKDSKKAA